MVDKKGSLLDKAGARKEADELRRAGEKRQPAAFRQVSRPSEAGPVEAKPAEAAPAEVEPAEVKPRTYVVQAGDNLSKIAKELLGNANRWPEIQAANKDKIKDPNLIYPGQELVIPGE